ncbi:MULTISPECIES: hypothetical protein [Bacillus cereus group]|uniref:Uncharacterized protein n=3 Tax=Bacillus cereus group TaxID=86661 RepID=A0ABD6TTN6_9BACI|nr:MULTISPECIES: hypothetical protein [Bacillus cereus group]EJQ50970.1 hypothetical protein IEI_02654 [Bacillus wiedmannii]KAA0789684.1 hypothetical protein DN394_14035 [Bacillus sp. BB081]KMP28100.1 hypothetical protein TU50_12955 [Bacillus wiedmannii]MED2839637.1 hypothetical protein [Bacillus wiedmannii]OAK38072.1 hypothetical protein A6284_24120 [Bacillus wiedmannii]
MIDNHMELLCFLDDLEQLIHQHNQKENKLIRNASKKLGIISKIEKMRDETLATVIEEIVSSSITGEDIKLDSAYFLNEQPENNRQLRIIINHPIYGEDIVSCLQEIRENYQTCAQRIEDELNFSVEIRVTFSSYESMCSSSYVDTSPVYEDIFGVLTAEDICDD